MKPKISVGLLILTCAALCSCVSAPDCFAAFSLSVRPYEGGFDLDFGKINLASGPISKEITVNITSTIAKQYRLTESLLDPLSNLQGSSIATGTFTVYGIRGSNKGGTLNVEQELPVTLGRQVIYTSDQAGTPDSFTLVFTVKLSPDVASGSYRGRIAFTLEPIDSTQAPVVTVLNIFAEVEIASSIEIRNGTGGKNILLTPDKERSEFSDCVIDIKGGLGNQFQISQVVTEQPLSQEGKLLDWEAVTLSGSGAKKGIVINQPIPLSNHQQVIYTSSVRGDADSFVVSYQLGDLSGQQAGTYRSKIKYILEGSAFSASRLINTLDLEIDIPRVFDLIIKPEIGGSISFRDLRPNQPPKIQEVVFQIRSNIAKPYQVTQRAQSLLTSKEGYVIPKTNFTLKEESLETKGILKYPSKIELKQGEMVLFVSDSDGSADKFKVIYELTVPRDIIAGDYYTNFTFSVSEI